MPLLGRGSEIRNSMGGGTLPAPQRLFNDLATWQMIPFLYTRETRRKAEDLLQHAVEPDKLARLVATLEDETGHELAFATEAGKIQANSQQDARIDLKVLERGLSAPLEDMQHCLAPPVASIQACARETLAQAEIDPAAVNRLVLVGGSSLLGAVQQSLQALCPDAEVETQNAMTAVADGLALSAQAAFG